MDNDQRVPKVITNAEIAALHLKDGDILVLRVSDDMDSSFIDRITQQLRKMVEITCHQNIALCILTPDMDLDIVKSEKEISKLRSEVVELKQQIAKILDNQIYRA